MSDNNAQPSESTRRARFRKHWNERGTHAPYPTCFHDADTDEVIGLWELVSNLLADVHDGEVVTITVTPSGSIDRESHWRLVHPHEYGRVNGDSPERASCTNGAS